MKNRDKFITVLFMAFIFILPIATVINGFLPQKATDETDIQKEILEGNGTLQDGDTADASATTTTESVATDVQGFEALQTYMNDFTESLAFRSDLIAFNTDLTAFMTGGSYIESTQVLAGKEGWLFYKTRLDGEPLYDYMGVNHFTDDELAHIAANLTATKEYFNGLGIDFYATCLPNKEMIYEEYMPDTVVRPYSVSRGQQMAEYVKANTDVVFTYPLQALLDSKGERLIYYKTDTHWNHIGAFVGVNELFGEAYGVKDSLENVSFGLTPESYPGDLAYIAGLSDKYPKNDVYTFDPESADESMYRDEVCVIVGDSFGGFYSTICKAYYKDVHWIMIQDYTYEELMSYDPDVVIWESVERLCHRFNEETIIPQ